MSIIILIIVFLLGIGIGSALSNFRWVKNSDTYIRIEYSGHLYKSIHSEWLDEDPKLYDSYMNYLELREAKKRAMDRK